MRNAIEIFGLVTITYFTLLNAIYLGFTMIAWRSLTSYLRERSYSAEAETFASPLTPPISILLPGYNEETGVVESVRSLLSLRYPEFEVIVINDGSTDTTLDRLETAFELIPPAEGDARERSRARRSGRLRVSRSIRACS